MTNTFCAPESDLEIWQERLLDLLDDCVGSAALEEVERIRDAVGIILGHDVDAREPVDERRIEALLAAGAPESAVICLLGPKARFMVSRGNESCLATVVEHEGSREVMAEGATMALALLAAHVSALLADSETALEELTDLTSSSTPRLH